MSDTIEFRVGTASWTDPTLVNSDLFYPSSVRSAEERLRFYAEQFNTVEVDSTYYALPAERNTQLWAERTPDGGVAAFKQLREMMPARERSNRQLTRPSKEVVEMAFQMFWSAMAPLVRGPPHLGSTPARSSVDLSNAQIFIRHGRRVQFARTGG